jgi:hypothetical protein
MQAVWLAGKQAGWLAAGKLATKIARDLRPLNRPSEDSMSIQEESDEEGIREQDEDVEDIGDIMADENMRMTWLMVDC